MRAVVARWAQAVIAIFLILATSSIATWIAVTLSNLIFTVYTCEAWPASACVATLTTVGACAPITTGGMVCTVVQVLITEETTPAFITGTLPRDSTGTMSTSIMGDTLITQATLPAWSAKAFPGFVAITILLSTA